MISFKKIVLVAIVVVAIVGNITFSSRVLWSQEVQQDMQNALQTNEGNLINVRGTVKDERGDPLVGATVRIKNTTRGGKTDLDGRFSFDLKPTDIIVISSLGYETKELGLTEFITNGVAEINISLTPKAETIDEVVVIGYGVQNKKDVTGSVQNVTSKDFNTGAIVSPEQLFTGKSAGVNVTLNSGEPGTASTVRIRGGTSINAGNDPLYVIDGVPIDNSGVASSRNPLNLLNPNAIESITVLKDASSTAIYGSRGANGVIMITTKTGKKSGKDGKATFNVSYSGTFSVSVPTKTIPMLDAETFRKWVAVIDEGKLQNDPINKVINPDKVVVGSNGKSVYSTNWMNELTRVAFGHSHNVSISGGSQNLGYFASVGYQNQEGIVKGSQTEKVTLATTLNSSVLDEHLDINLNVKGAYTRDRFTNNGTIGNAASWNPTVPVNDPSDTRWGGYTEYPNDNGPKNPVSQLLQPEDYGKNIRSIGNLELLYKFHFFSDLGVKLNLAYDVSLGERTWFKPSTMREQSVDSGRVRRESPFKFSKLLEAYLVYNKKFTDFSLDAVAGYSYQDFTAEYPSFEGYKLSTNTFGYNSVTPARERDINTSYEANKLISFWGRVNFSLFDKYLLTATIRSDGSSRFGPENKWGIFPSGSLAWQILKEFPMLKEELEMSEFKLRISAGLTGNQEIGNYKYLGTYTLGDDKTGYNIDGRYVQSLRPNGYDPGLKWEETFTLNGGIDFGFLDDRINGSIDVYWKRTNDLLFEATAIQPSLANQILTNIGSFENIGVELSLVAYPIVTTDFQWEVSLNTAFNKQTIVQLENSDPNFIGYLRGGIGGGVGNNIQVLKVGQPIDAFLVYKQKYDSNGKPFNDRTDYNKDGFVNNRDFYEDVNGDGTVDEKDRVPFGKPAPDVTIGLTNKMTFFDALDVSFTLRASIGNYVYNSVAAQGTNFERVTGAILNNLHSKITEVQFRKPQYFSSHFVEDASYLRLENITVSYRFFLPGTPYSIRAYITGQNLFVITGYSGLDPENPSGIDTSYYPRSLSTVVGLDLNF
ncbi:hypothetical protein CHS0354_024084 [Potamilus streckersoni]|uniref:TonB-dependent receptor plug domain-containing protein n=1 Tax=Potamilus streckersoni TaxID=2493646 RepID=A0AAE0RZM0_9BIVA|nr:hypothetical protein CHS0354_024084 [Potamilus streckersoni]